MHRLSRTSLIVLAIIAALVAAAAIVCRPPRAAATIYPTPTWHVGDWWEVEECGLSLSAPVERWGAVWRERFTVERTTSVGGYACYVVSQRGCLTGGTLDQAFYVYYFSKNDLSLVRWDEMDPAGKTTRYSFQTPGQPLWAGNIPGVWPAFPLREGSSRSASYADTENFRRADGSTRRLKGKERFYGILVGELPTASVTTEHLNWGGRQREVFLARFRKGEDRDIEEGNMRWVPGLAWPAQTWTKTRWTRLVASSRALTYSIPIPEESGYDPESRRYHQ